MRADRVWGVLLICCRSCASWRLCSAHAVRRAVGAFRSRARIPVLTWACTFSEATIWRCSQPRVRSRCVCELAREWTACVRAQVGYATRSLEDEGLISLIGDLNSECLTPQ